MGKPMKRDRYQAFTFLKIISLALIFLPLLGCRVDAPVATTQPGFQTEERRADGLSQDEAATLNSLVLVDDYPLYTMHYFGGYDHRAALQGDDEGLKEVSRSPMEFPPEGPAWDCSLFAALGDDANMLYGRNFDWEYSPAILLFTDPPDGYASVSMVDIAYLGFSGEGARKLVDLSLTERTALLDAPFLPFDGMNERGLAIGMAAVPPGDMRLDPQKETIDSLMIIRKMLDQASTVDEAVSILGNYNIDYGSGPPLHYLIADASGEAVLVEFYQGEMVVIPNENPWHLATNFLRASVGENTRNVCWRYDRLIENLSETGGRVSASEAMDFLREVSQENTQWSIVYGMSMGEVGVVMARQYDEISTFSLDFSGE
jgi:hypothetical protein